MLNGLKLFLTILEKGGLSAAGRELGLSPASVSERLAALESYYGVTLLTRTTRSLRLTEEGRVLAEGARRLLAESEELESRIRLGVDKLSGPVRLSAPVDLGHHRIVPLLDQFLAEHPEVSVDLDLTDGVVDLVSQGVDFAVRYGTLPDSGLKSRPLGRNRRVVCAAPSYLQAHGTPQHPQDLVHHDCIVMRFGPHIDRAWSFSVHGQMHTVTVTGRRVANHGNLVRQWCLAGHGLCRKSVWDVQDDLDQGRLVEVLADFAGEQSAVQMVYAATRVQPRRVRALMDRIAQAFEPLAPGPGAEDPPAAARPSP